METSVTPAALRPEIVSWRERWFDRFLGSDPGLNRLRLALRTIVTIGAILVTEWLFVHVTHALQLPTNAGLPAAQVTTANHEFLIIAMMAGAMIGMMSSFGVNDKTAKGQLLTMLLLPCAMIPALAFGLAVGSHHRAVAMGSLAVFLSIGAYLRRFGPRGFIFGQLLFMGDFLGFFMSAAIPLKHIGWLAAEISVGLVTAAFIRFVFFFPRPARDLKRTQRSYGARARNVTRLALELFNNPENPHGARRLHGQLVRLNEAALMIDAQLGNQEAIAEDVSSQHLHQRLFDIELALTNIARFTPVLQQLGLPEKQLTTVRAILEALVQRDYAAATKRAQQLVALVGKERQPAKRDDNARYIVPHRFASSVIALCEGVRDWDNFPADTETPVDFEPAVNLFGGWLPGSNRVSANASREPGTRGIERLGLQPYTRTAIQMGVAVGLAIIVGDLVSPRRFYWAVIAAFITFMGVSNAGEQVRKAVYRVIGTFIGITLGSWLVSLIGPHSVWSIVAIMVALFFGLYLMRISYVFMVIGITVMVSQLYVELGEFTNSLLLLRLKETTIGAVIAISVVMFVLPLRTRRVFKTALREYMEALSRLTEQAGNRLLGKNTEDETTLHSLARSVDAAYQALLTTAKPLRRNLTGRIDEEIAESIRLASAARSYSRNLVVDIESGKPLDTKLRTDTANAVKTLQGSLQAIVDTLSDGKPGTYTRAAALFDRTERQLEKQTDDIHRNQLALRDLQLLDGTLAQIAGSLGMPLTDYDTGNFEETH